MGKFFVLFSLLTFSLKSFGQCSATASNGDYTVTLTLVPSVLIPSSTSCAFGFNYNLRAGYKIEITGPNVPSGGINALYTSQGTLTCNNGTNGNQTLFLDLANGVTGSGGLETISTSSPYSSLSDCNTATPKTYNCNSFSFEVQGPNLSTTVTCPVTPAAFPIKLVDFVGRNQLGINKLTWKVTESFNFESFMVQKSYDAKSFETVSSKIFLENKSEYSWSEKSNNSKNNTYYRLLMKDNNGEIEYSKIIAVENFDKTVPVVLFPVPAYNELNLQLDSSLFNPEKLEVYSLSGKKLIENNMVNKIELKNLPEGSYYLKLTDRFDREITKKFIKTN